MLPRALAQRTPDGAAELDVDARTVRELVRALEPRVPGLGEALESNLSIAIDGEIVNDPLLEEIGPSSEVHFVPRIAGG